MTPTPANPIEGGQGRTPDELIDGALSMGWVAIAATVTGGVGWLVALIFH